MAAMHLGIPVSVIAQQLRDLLRRISVLSKLRLLMVRC